MTCDYFDNAYKHGRIHQYIAQFMKWKVVLCVATLWQILNS